MANIISDMLNAVTKAIYDEFGDSYNVYAEQINSELAKPCFTVTLPSVIQSRKLSNCYIYDLLFVVQFFPSESSQAPYGDCTETQYKLMCCLEKVANRQATDVQGNIVDEVLTMQARYKIHATKQVDYGTLGKLKIKYESR